MKARVTKPVFVQKIWGGRSLKRLYNKPLPAGKKIGESWELWNRAENTPFVIKLLDVKKPLSVQVHPSGKKGKSEAWYFLETGKTTRTAAGLAKKLKKNDIKPAAWSRLLAKGRVRPGDLVYLPGGTIHTIYPPAVILEVSQPKLITYRLYDWRRQRGKLDTELGLKTLKTNNRPRIYRRARSFRCPFFKLRVRELEPGRQVNLKSRKLTALFIVQGKIRINQLVAGSGQTVVMPRAATVTAIGKTKLLEITR